MVKLCAVGEHFCSIQVSAFTWVELKPFFWFTRQETVFKCVYVNIERMKEEKIIRKIFDTNDNGRWNRSRPTKSWHDHINRIPTWVGHLEWTRMYETMNKCEWSKECMHRPSCAICLPLRGRLISSPRYITLLKDAVFYDKMLIKVIKYISIYLKLWKQWLYWTNDSKWSQQNQHTYSTLLILIQASGFIHVVWLFASENRSFYEFV